MKPRKKIDYTLRGVPPDTDARIREAAAAEGVSVNATLLRLINRGLGDPAAPARKRDLRSLVRITPDPEDEKFMRQLLAEMNVVDESIWK